MSGADPYDYAVVGSGAGGGVVAARLAQAGHRVLLLEAGADAPAGDCAERLPEDYRVPAFHPFASEHPALSWNFFVRHYDAEARQKLDPKYLPSRGVLYPRAASLGGCTTHNAMIVVYPHNEDWDAIARLTGDSSWSARSMRRYFVRLEECRHRPRLLRWLARLGMDRSRHGWRGWLATERSLPRAALRDASLAETLLGCARRALEEGGDLVEQVHGLLDGAADPNDWRAVCGNREGIGYLPLATDCGARSGVRELLIRTAAEHPRNLTLELDALATRVLFEDPGRAVGVEYLKGTRLYRAHCNPGRQPGERREVRVRREVILCGGAFNTPQLLMLSGVGPRRHLEQHGIRVRVDLPGVGRNLQDRYEVGVVHRMRFRAWDVLEGARFTRDDAQYAEWSAGGQGVYATNGCVMSVRKRSTPKAPLPDLCCLGLLSNFSGYFPGYSAAMPKSMNYLTWALLKAHTENRAGSVELASADPLEPPRISFRYFEEGSDAAGEDLRAVVEGIRFVRRMMKDVAHLVEQEELPGEHVQSDADLAEFVRNHAWGHHASCSCPIGPRDQNGVLSSEFEVHGTRGLRVVDASVFPRIPGFFLMAPVYMVAEKAAEVIQRRSNP